jgi:hypothetical protein
VIVASPPCAEFGKDAAILEQRQALLVGLVYLAFVAPICVDKLEVCLADKSEERDLIENGVDPQPLGEYAEVANVAV